MRIIVQLTRISDQIIRQLEQLMDIDHISHRSLTVSGDAPPTNVPRIRSLPFVSGVYKDVTFRGFICQFTAPETPVDFLASSGKFYTNWQAAQFMNHPDKKAKSVKVAILDTGINSRHPSLKVHRKIQIAPGDPNDKVGHGTWIAGTIAARPTETDIGTVAGSAQGVKLIDVKVLDDNATGLASWIIRGIDAAIDEGAKVINMSLSTPGPCIPPVTSAIRSAINEGTVVVCAAGNFGPQSRPGCPANLPETISVGSVYPYMYSNGHREVRILRSPFSPSYPDITAIGGSTSPPVYIVSTVHDTFKGMAGTSMAAPFVTSAAALVLSEHPDLSPQQVKSVLISSATRWFNGQDPSYGFGLLNFSKALSTSTTATTTTPTATTTGGAPGARGAAAIITLLIIAILALSS